ncbi:ABC transporter substrate-binding protein [Anaeromicropila herbilytica]|uniref:Basic amino acid ABC transporter substrate-binding protein n=1 Tax=Anaeromicropila herbilytica TaxID=2785025 RepID=A0A7R7EIS2_9FIRM|nr:ABC transporter substrate-binding protein [Anaeromicropila herbilytica]BCN29499.1 basic amino acid ABC transporter substrate-binding protein [Anaeromicropila herbilytica]
MKKGFVIIALAIMTLTLTACGKKNTDNQLIVGTEAGFAPYEYLKGDKVVGIDMDIAQAIADSMGKKLVIKNMDFQGALTAVQSGKVDLVIAGVSVNEKRKKVMDFSEDYVNSTEVVVVNKENPTVSSLNDLDNKIIGVQLGNIADSYVSNEDNVKAKEVKRYTKFAQASEDLKNGKIDCIVMDQYPAKELVAKNTDLTTLDGTLFQDKYAVALKKGNDKLLNEVNKVIKELKESGKIDEFTAKYTGK